MTSASPHGAIVNLFSRELHLVPWNLRWAGLGVRCKVVSPQCNIMVPHLFQCGTSIDLDHHSPSPCGNRDLDRQSQDGTRTTLGTVGAERLMGAGPAQQETRGSSKHGALSPAWKWGKASDGPKFFHAQGQVLLKITTITFHSAGKNKTKWGAPRLQHPYHTQAHSLAWAPGSYEESLEGVVHRISSSSSSSSVDRRLGPCKMSARSSSGPGLPTISSSSSSPSTLAGAMQ